MRITDLNFDCLERCFRHLKIDELLNVAESNVHLRHAAKYIFHRKYGHQVVCFLSTTNFQSKEERNRSYVDAGNLVVFDDVLFISDLKSSLQFLRCFGDKISAMKFLLCGENDRPTDFTCKHRRMYSNNLNQLRKRQQCEYLLIEYINEFCAESLKKVKLNGDYFDYIRCDFSMVTKPFVRVETLQTNVPFQIPLNLTKMFPNLRELAMICANNRAIDGEICLRNEFIANHFPSLEHLRINIGDQFDYSKENFAIALRLNPQIKSLWGNVWLEVLLAPDNITTWNGNDHFQSLETLYLALDLSVDPTLIEILTKPIGDDDEELRLNNLKKS